MYMAIGTINAAL